jgi:transcriptional regulator with GAF, ATPase, and Fis domain
MQKSSGDNRLHEQLIVSQAVNRIALLLNRTAAFEKAIEKMISEFVDLVDADECSIQVLRPASETTRCTLIRNAKGHRLLDKRLDHFMTGWVLKHKEALLTVDLTALLAEIGSAAERYAEVRSALAAPLRYGSDIIGAVNLIRTRDELFTERDRQMISSLAQQIGEFIEGAALREQLFAENERLREDLDNRYLVHGIIGHSPAIKDVYTLLQQVIPTSARVVLLGESGTGKELVAKCIHHAGPRQDKPFIAVDCGALPANLLESELFGYVRGAFTGATRDRRGLIEEADKGTLFLDEITNMSIETQAKLLRVIQEEEIRPVGSNKLKKVDVRVIVAASTALAEEVAEGTFRSDLYYRLNVISIRVPSLRERLEDIPDLADLFVRRFAKKHMKTARKIAYDTLQLFARYSWPGNIRELENVIERAVVVMHIDETTLLPKHLPDELMFDGAAVNSMKIPLQGDLPDIVASYEREILKRVLQQHNWNQTSAAQALNISEAVMRYKIKRLQIKRPA